MVFNVKDSDERVTVKAEDLPYEVIKVENDPIRMRDGALLYGYLWIPKKVYDGESQLKLGTIVEYLPYRKSDFTTVRDSIRHPYYAGYGFASMRVDMRGCGDSDDVILGEYLEQEQLDNYDLFSWIQQQPWSNGHIAQFGKSWGGFNGLQIAAKQHPALKCIITLCSTDDRYADDVHYRGGCMLASDMLWWASTMFAYNARPQDPSVRPDWRETWMKRLELDPNIIDWVSHQTRDEFWKHGSICEDYSKVDIPVMAVGGWRDGYTNSIFRMMEHLPNKDNKSVIGPWVHEFPEVATPSPAIGYNQMAVQWFDKYINTEPEIRDGIKKKLNVKDFHVDQLHRFNAYIQEPVSIAQSYEFRPGKWVGCKSIDEPFEFTVSEGKIRETPAELSSSSFSFSGTQEYGQYRGTWCPFGQSGDFPADQKYEDINSFNIESEPLTQDYEVFGHPELTLEVASDVPQAQLSVRLVDLNPHTKEHTLVSWAPLNLNKYVGTNEHPVELKPGQKYKVSVKLDAIGYIFKQNHRMRLCFSTTDWPSFWPLAQTPTLTTTEASVSLKLPKLATEAATIDNIPQAESLSPCDRVIVREDGRTRSINHDLINNTFEIQDYSDEGERIVNGIQFGSWNKNNWHIKRDDPLAAKNSCEWELVLKKEAWDVKLHTFSTMESDGPNYSLYNKLVAFEASKQVFEKEWSNTIPRNFT